MELASYVNNRNNIIATIVMLLAVSVITNVILSRRTLDRETSAARWSGSRMPRIDRGEPPGVPPRPDAIARPPNPRRSDRQM